MNRREGMRVWGSLVGGLALLIPMRAHAAEAAGPKPYVRLAEIEIDATRIEEYRTAVSEQILDAIRLEPGVLALYAVHDRSNPARVRVFEIYADEAAYLAHLRTPHFAKYKAAVHDIVKSLDLLETTPIALGSKPR